MRSVARVGVEEAAELAGCSKSTLLRHIRAGKLPASKGQGNSWQIDTGELSRVYAESSARAKTARATPPDDREEIRRLRDRVRELDAEMAERRAEVALERRQRQQLASELEAARRLAGHRNHATPPYAGPDPVLRALTRVADRWRDWWEGPV